MKKNHLKRKRILVADDDQAILDVIDIVLVDAGYEVIKETHGEKVIGSLHVHMPHLMLLDNWLSGANGKEIITEVKKNPKTKHIPVILVSANNETAEIAKAAGADDFLAKPFDLKELLAIVKKYS